MAKRGTQQDDEPDGTLVVDLEKYSIPDGTRCVWDVVRVCERYYFVISGRFVSLSGGREGGREGRSRQQKQIKTKTNSNTRAESDFWKCRKTWASVTYHRQLEIRLRLSKFFLFISNKKPHFQCPYRAAETFILFKCKITERCGKKWPACFAALAFTAFYVPPKFHACSYIFDARTRDFLSLSCSYSFVTLEYLAVFTRSVTVDTARHRCTEGLFKPSVWGKDNPGIHELTFKAIMACSIDIRKQMCRNIYLSGGGSMSRGWLTRFNLIIVSKWPLSPPPPPPLNMKIIDGTLYLLFLV